MNTEVICALIAVGGTCLSAVVAWLVSRSTANREIEKLRLTWEHDAFISSDDEFSEMAAAVSSFLIRQTSANQQHAASKVNAMRTKESGELAIRLDMLSKSIASSITLDIENNLSEVINEKRKAKR